MAASVEVRVPLLDKKLVNYFFNSISLSTNKYRLKARLSMNLKSRMGNQYKKIKKQGFRYPTDDWMTRHVDWIELKNLLSPILNTQKFHQYLNQLNKNSSQVSMETILHLYFIFMGQNF